MDKEDREKLRRELESLVGELRGSSRQPYSSELEYHLSRLTTALSAITHLGYRSMHLHDRRTELLAQIDALLAQTHEIQEFAGRVREVLLWPPPEEKPADPPGFGE